MAWIVKLDSAARRDLNRLKTAHEQAWKEAVEAIAELADNPLTGAVELRNNKNTYRTRFYRERYRLIFHVSHASKTVIVERIRERGPYTYSGYE